MFCNHAGRHARPRFWCILDANSGDKRMRVLPMIFLFAAMTQAQTPPASPIANVAGRTTTSLNGPWHIIVDPLETGLNAEYYRNRKPKDKRELVEYDFEASETLNVPGDWNTQK